MIGQENLDDNIIGELLEVRRVKTSAGCSQREGWLDIVALNSLGTCPSQSYSFDGFFRFLCARLSYQAL